jgi:competence protein ComEA
MLAEHAMMVFATEAQNRIRASLSYRSRHGDRFAYWRVRRTTTDQEKSPMTRLRLWLPFAFVLAALLSFAAPSVAQTSKDIKPGSRSAATKSARLDINFASKVDLMALPGIGEADALKIIASRPFKRKDELVTRKIIPDGIYDKIKSQIIATQAAKK